MFKSNIIGVASLYYISGAKAIKLRSKSDPICSSAGCEQYLHPESKEETWPMNYPVANFG